MELKVTERFGALLVASYQFFFFFWVREITLLKFDFFFLHKVITMQI